MIKHIRPVGYNAAYPVSSKYGPRKLGAQNQFHAGIDFAVPVGTPVLASQAGVVVEIDPFQKRDPNGYGMFIAIQHGDGTISFYAHLSAIKPKIQKGVHVSAGDVIGFSGNTGRSTGPHLHYEIRTDYNFPSTANNTVNPEPLIMTENEARAFLGKDPAPVQTLPPPPAVVA